MNVTWRNGFTYVEFDIEVGWNDDVDSGDTGSDQSMPIFWLWGWIIAMHKYLDSLDSTTDSFWTDSEKTKFAQTYKIMVGGNNVMSRQQYDWDYDKNQAMQQPSLNPATYSVYPCPAGGISIDGIWARSPNDSAPLPFKPVGTPPPTNTFKFNLTYTNSYPYPDKVSFQGMYDPLMSLIRGSERASSGRPNMPPLKFAPAINILYYTYGGWQASYEGLLGKSISCKDSDGKVLDKPVCTSGCSSSTAKSTCYNAELSFANSDQTSVVLLSTSESDIPPLPPVDRRAVYANFNLVLFGDMTANSTGSAKLEQKDVADRMENIVVQSIDRGIDHVSDGGKAYSLAEAWDLADSDLALAVITQGVLEVSPDQVSLRDRIRTFNNNRNASTRMSGSFDSETLDNPPLFYWAAQWSKADQEAVPKAIIKFPCPKPKSS
jgi:hypothetical protein